MASTIAAITTGIGGIVTTADATGNLSLLSGTSTVVAVTSAGAAVTGTMSVSGNVGIGTSSPTNRLTINSVSGTSPSFLLQGQDNTERLHITSAGASGGTPVFGAFSSRGTTASPTAAQSGDAIGYYQFGGYDGSGFNRSAWISGLAAENYSATNRGSNLTFSTTPIGSTTIAERMRINSTGTLLVGSTSLPASAGSAKIFSSDSIGALNGFYCKAGGAATTFGNQFNFNWSGSTLQAWVDTTNIGNVTVTSDYRIKKYITTQSLPALARIAQIRPVNYERTVYKNLYKDDGVIREGFIAHELQAIIPSAVEGEKDAENQIQTLNLDALCSVMVKAIQEQQALIIQLQADVAALKGVKV